VPRWVPHGWKLEGLRGAVCAYHKLKGSRSVHRKELRTCVKRQDGNHDRKHPYHWFWRIHHVARHVWLGDSIAMIGHRVRTLPRQCTRRRHLASKYSDPSPSGCIRATSHWNLMRNEPSICDPRLVQCHRIRGEQSLLHKHRKHCGLSYHADAPTCSRCGISQERHPHRRMFGLPWSSVRLGTLWRCHWCRW